MPTTAARRYLVEFGSATAAYVALVWISSTVVRAHPDAGWRYAVAVAPLWGVGLAVARRRYR